MIEGRESVPEEQRFKCNTVACVAGHAALLRSAEKGAQASGEYDVEDEAQEWLGLTNGQTSDLFTPSFQNNPTIDVCFSMSDLTIGDALFALKHLRDHDWVNWNKPDFVSYDPANPQFYYKLLADKNALNVYGFEEEVNS
jgi:hypothetical protein